MAVEINTIAKKEYGEIVVADPFKPEEYHAAADVVSLVKSANERVKERQEALEKLDRLNTEEVKKLRLECEKDDELLKNFGSNLSKALLTLSGFEAYVVQTKGAGTRIDPLSARGRLAAIIKDLKDQEKKNKENQAAPMPIKSAGTGTIKKMLVIDATPEAWKKIEAAIGKAGIVKGFCGVLNTAARIKAVKMIVDSIEAEEASAAKEMGAL